MNDSSKSMLIHEIINPLNIIVGYAELSKIESELSKKNEHLDEIIRQSMLCCSMLNEKLNQQLEHIISLDFLLNTLDNSVSNLNKYELKKTKHLNININIINEHIVSIKNNYSLKCNITYFKIIFNNILINAIKYSKKNSNININISFNNDHLMINCENTINPELKPNTTTTTTTDTTDTDTTCNDINTQFMTSHHIGLTVIDNLVDKIKGYWLFYQNKNRINVDLYIPYFKI
jgi:signal transduction histidine kinase